MKSQELKEWFEENFLKNTCFDTVDDLMKDKTDVNINAPRAMVACNLQGAWWGILELNKFLNNANS